jgi:hypothetical protein
MIWVWVAPVVSGAFLAVTGALLLWDLEHPRRFYLIFTRPQWQSWLVKGAFIIAGYSLLLLVHFVVSNLSYHGPTPLFRRIVDVPIGVRASIDPWAAQFLSWLTIAGIPLAVLSAVYTAYLFAQAKARDMCCCLLAPGLSLECCLHFSGC